MNNDEPNTELEAEIEEIDFQHSQIFDRLNSYLAVSANTASRDELIKLLEDMHDRLAAHFSYEEELLSERRLISTSHLSKHVQLSNRLRQCVTRLRNNDGNDIDVHAVLLSVYEWYVEHLEHDDAVFYTPRKNQ